MIINKYYEDPSVLHVNTTAHRSFYIPFTEKKLELPLNQKKALAFAILLMEIGTLVFIAISTKSLMIYLPLIELWVQIQSLYLLFGKIMGMTLINIQMLDM